MNSTNTCADMHKLLLDIGINPGLKGYEYITVALQKIIDDPSYLKGITYRLYPEVASQLGTTSCAIERGIRHAIQHAFDSLTPSKIEHYFGHSIKLVSGTVTNKVFLATIAKHWTITHSL